MSPEALPLLARLEWHVAGSRVVARAIDHGLHRPHRLYRELRAKLARAIGPALPEAHIYSQNGEDGIIAEIFRRAGTTNRHAVEFGVGDGTECCSRALIEQGWNATILEGASWAIPRIRELHLGKPVSVREAFITAETITSLLRECDVPREPDLLVVDIDGNDYWVLEAILRDGFRPRVLCVEYNGRWVPPVDWVMPYKPDHRWDGSVYQGASLVAMDRLARSYGYQLVGCESHGVNAFFVREDLTHLFQERHRSVRSHYAPPWFGRGFGHPVRMRLRDLSAGR
jgi:hypothetical protein